MSEDKIFPREPAVQLLTLLSEGAYTSFAKAIREIVSNSFDASANNVWLEFSKDKIGLTIKDDGTGFPEEAFDEEFLRISGSRRRESGDINEKTHRPIIGVYGIGVLAIAVVCEKAVVRTKVEGESEGTVREIPFSHLFDPKIQREDLRKHYFSKPVGTGRFSAKKAEHFTIIELKNIKGHIRTDLNRNQMSPEGLEKFSQLSGLERFERELGLLIPVQYYKGYPIYGKGIPEIDLAKKELEDFKFRVYVNGKELFKSIYLRHRFFSNFKWEYGDSSVVPEGEFEVTPIRSESNARVSFFGYIYDQTSQIFPTNLRGILIRMAHVGIKGYDERFYGFSRVGLGPAGNQISGEIFVTAGLDSALQLTKDDFKDNPAFEELVEKIHDKIHIRLKAMKKRSRDLKSKKATTNDDWRKVPFKDLEIDSPVFQEVRSIAGEEKWLKLFPPTEELMGAIISQMKSRLKKLTPKVISEDEYSYLTETISCYENDCRRASIVMMWNAAMCRIYRKIEEKGFDKFHEEIKKVQESNTIKWPIKYTQTRVYKTLEEFQANVYSEAQIIAGIYGLKLINAQECDLMRGFLEFRNKCAHSTRHKPKPGEPYYNIKFLVDQVFDNDKFRVK